MRYEWFLGFRYLKSRRKTGFISVISIITIAGVTLGVAIVILAISVMNGFEYTIKNKFLSNEAHLIVRTGLFFNNYERILEEIQQIPSVIAVSPVIYKPAAIQPEGRGSLVGLIIKGIDPGLEDRVTGVSRFVEGGMKFDIPPKEEIRTLDPDITIRGGIVLGKSLATRLRVERGDVIVVLSELRPTPMGQLMPVMRNFVVTGFYESGMYLYDDNLAFISLTDAQALYNISASVNHIQVLLDNPDKANVVRGEIIDKFGFDFLPTRTWMDMHADLFDAMKLEKKVTFVIEALIILVAAFSITSTLIMMVMEKTRDIGILKAMGATSRSIRLVFSMEGIVIGILGAILGTSLGLFLCWSLQTWLRIPINSTVYQISSLPVKISWMFVILVNIFALLICWLATLHPARQAAKLNPVEALRYE